MNSCFPAKAMEEVLEASLDGDKKTGGLEKPQKPK
jgi:hypothetical protein